jgi:hypothetical protein
MKGRGLLVLVMLLLLVRRHLRLELGRDEERPQLRHENLREYETLCFVYTAKKSAMP